MTELRVFRRGWKDRRWYKGLKKLPPDQQEQLKTAIRDLVADLMVCTHPTLDPRMFRWVPTKYHSHGRQRKYGAWYEYRLGDPKNTARVIVCHDTEERVLHLVARTVTHDHDRLQLMTSAFRP